MIIFNVLNIVIDSFVIIKKSFLPLKSVWECFFKWADPPDSQNGFTVLPYIKGVTESLTRIVNNDVMGSELPPDQLRPCNRNLLLPNQDLHQIGKRTLCIKSRANRTWNYIEETGRCLHTRKKEHIPNTKVLKSGSNKATLLILRMHASSTEAIHA